MSDSEHASSVGQTGGLPGANADPRTALVPEEDLKDTVAMADVAGADAGTDEAAGIGDPDEPAIPDTPDDAPVAPNPRPAS